MTSCPVRDSSAFATASGRAIRQFLDSAQIPPSPDPRRILRMFMAGEPMKVPTKTLLGRRKISIGAPT